MTTYNKTTLKTFFQTGDTPTGTDYANFIDSYVNIVETAAQNMAGPLYTTELNTARVSAAALNITGVASAAGLNVSGTVSANAINTSSLFANTVSAASLNITGDVSAATVTVYGSAIRSTNGLFSGVGIVSAAGTTQGTAAQLTNVVNRGKGVADGSTTGFAIPSNKVGWTQYLFNEGVSANLWPPSGGTINGLAANAAFSLAASAMVTIIHLTASAMAVK